MLDTYENTIKRLKKETNNSKDIVYREMIISKTKIHIIYEESLTSNEKISNFIIRSLNKINTSKTNRHLIDTIKNNISNFKVEKFDNFDSLCFYLHRGFTIILVENEKSGLLLETKGDITRSINEPDTESTIRGARDSFVENYQKNIGLIKKRIKTNDLWIENIYIGKYTKTQIGVLYINSIAKQELVAKVINRLKKINIDGIINSGTIKNAISNENKINLPTVMTTERPDISSTALLEGKVIIIIDNSPYAIIVPITLNEFFKTSEDNYSSAPNATFTRIIKYIAFFIALLTPAIYIALITYNQEMIPSELLLSFAVQRDGVPFPAFFEAFIMMISFEILRESDLRMPNFTGSSLSIVGALILGEAAVNAGIVSPIMIIVIALTSISSLPFAEVDLINGLRIYRLLFMLGASFLGIVGVVIIFIIFLIILSGTESFGKPYLMPYSPTNKAGLTDSIIKSTIKKSNKRTNNLSNNIIKQRLGDVND